MNKRQMLLAAAALCGLALAGVDSLAQQAAPQPGRTYRVGYTQIVDHPALNASRQGFLDGLKKAGFVEGQNLIFDYQNAQNDIANARNIAEKFLSDKVDLMAPCTTPSAQAAARVARDSAIPVAFGCVTNPVAAGIVPAFDKPSGTNVTGSYGLPPADRMLDVIAKISPNARRLGTIYNSSETNSQILNTLAKTEAEKRKLAWVEVQITSSAEVKNAVESLVGRVDAFLMPQDNTIASAFDAIIKTARDNKIPLYSLDTSTVERGAIASYAQDQYQTGVDWATDVAVPILLGRNAGTIPPQPYKAYELYVNTAAGTALGAPIPADVVKSASKVFEK